MKKLLWKLIIMIIVICIFLLVKKNTTRLGTTQTGSIAPLTGVVSTGIDLTNCVSYFDGCNNCSVKDGKAEACTLMYCETPSEPKCLQYATGSKTTGWTGNSGKTNNFGFIEGSLSYPSEGIPGDMEVCAENISTKEVICTKDHIENNKYTYHIGYKIKAPVGTYNVYAKEGNLKAYYSDFVICGLKAECPSHNLIPVSVTENMTISNIDPSDWYK